MITSLINLFAGYLSVITLGWVGLDIFGKRFSHKLSLLPTLAISFLIGASLINTVFTITMIGGHSISHPAVYFIVVICLLYTLFRLLAIRAWHTIDIRHYLTVLKQPLNLLIVAFISVILLHNLSWPVTDWDALTLYDFRGKIFSEGMRIEDFRTGIHDTYSTFDYYYSYPFMTSSLHAWSYILGASTPMIIYFGFYLSLVLMFLDKWGFKSGKLKLTHLFPLILATSPELFSHATIAYTNLPYAIFFFFSIYFLVDKDHYSPLLAVIMLISSFFTRSLEPFWVITLVVMMYVMIRKRQLAQATVLVGTFLLVRFAWLSYAVVDLTNARLVNISIFTILENFNLKEFFKIEFFLLKNYLTYTKIPALLAATGAYLAIRRGIGIELIWQIIATLSLAILFGGGFVFAQKYTVWSSIGPSAARMMLSFIPLLFYFSFTKIADYFDEKTK